MPFRQPIQHLILFILNTGARDNEVVNLLWEYEVPFELPNGTAFLLPSHVVKGGTVGERLLICNEVATNLLNSIRQPSGPVFRYKGKGMTMLNNSAWQNARKRHKVDISIHGLRHTFAHLLRAASVDSETRADLFRASS